MLLVLAGIITVGVWQLPFGGLILYPFTLLSTWFHEMGHGLTAIFMGADFDYLEINANAGGFAVSSNRHNMWLGNRLGSVMISLGGLIGPAIAGAIFIIIGTKKRLSTIILSAFSIFLMLSGVIWIRSLVGIAVIIGFGLLTGLIALKGKIRLQQFTIQFLGMQAALATFRRMDYLFTANANVGGRVLTSDVGKIEENLFLPYWFWGILISTLSILLIIGAFKIAFKPAKNDLS